MVRSICLIALFLSFSSISALRADQADFFTAIQLFKLSVECPIEPWHSTANLLPNRGLETNQVSVDVEGITVAAVHRMDMHDTPINKWLTPVLYRVKNRMNFLELPLMTVSVREPPDPKSALPPYYELNVDCMPCHWPHNGWGMKFYVCDKERASNAKIALEALIALAKAGDAHFAGLPQPPTTEGGYSLVQNCVNHGVLISSTSCYSDR